MKLKTIAGVKLLLGGIIIGIIATIIAVRIVVRPASPRAQPAASCPSIQHQPKAITDETQSPVSSAAQPVGALSGANGEAETAVSDSGGQGQCLTPRGGDTHAGTPATAPEVIPAAAAVGPELPPSVVPAGNSPTYRSASTTYYVFSTPAQIQPGAPPTEFTTTVSGYPVATGGALKAVDYPQTDPAPWTVGANGLMQNPCVDPPSTMGRAYARDSQ